MNWSFSPCSSLWVMPKVEWWSHFSPRDSNLWKVSLMMISWNCNITLMNEMSNMAAPKAHLSSFSSYFPGNHSWKINILNGILIIPFLRLFWMSNMAAPKAHLSSSSFLGNHSRKINMYRHVGWGEARGGGRAPPSFLGQRGHLPPPPPMFSEISNVAAPKAHLSSSSFLGNHNRKINVKLVLTSILRLFWKCTKIGNYYFRIGFFESTYELN